MNDNTQPLIEQIKDNGRWYFGHDDQVITSLGRLTGLWSAIVYPADCIMASVFSNDIHLHCVGSHSRYTAVNYLLLSLNTLIGDRFSFWDPGQAPVLERQGPPCNCVQRTATLTVVEHRDEVQVESVNIEASDEPDQPPVDMTTDPASPVAQPSATRDVWPVLEKIENTLEAIEQRMHYGPVETSTLHDSENVDPGVVTPDRMTHTPEQLRFPTDRSPVPGVSQLETETGTDSFLSLHSPAHFIQPVGEMPSPTKVELETRMRGLAREEIGRVLAAALDSLAAPRWLGDVGGT